VENPAVAGRSVHGVLAVTDLAVATSGDYRNFFEHGGKRYSHSIDPRSGYPVDHNLVSVTVLHKSAMTADAMATALTVLGPEAGMQLAKALDLPVWFIVREGNKWIDSYSPAIESYRVN
jgi:thiamine biosynthesis lipoprotein